MECDVVVVGAGLTGLALAASLAQADLSVAVVDKVLPTGHLSPNVDLRVFAITPASADFLKSLGVWELLAATRLSPYQRMFVWDQVGGDGISFDSQSVHRDHLGHIIENQVLIAGLWQRCQQLGVSFYGDTPVAWQENHKGICLSLTNGDEINATLLVGADGAESWVRTQAAIPTGRSPYGHDAIVATIRLGESHRRTARQCFMTEGPLALLPLVDPHLCSIVWSTLPEHADRLMAMDEQAFASRILSIYQDKVGSVILESARIRFPLVARHADTYAAGRAVLVGDAAHTIHPLAGQGANLGLYDVVSLKTLICDAAKQQRDIGNPILLQRYQRARRGHNAIMSGAMSVFKEGFASQNSAITWLRNWGFRTVDGQNLLKNQFIQHAMGYASLSPI